MAALADGLAAGPLFCDRSPILHLHLERQVDAVSGVRPGGARHCRHVVGDAPTLTRLLTATFVGLVCHLGTPHMTTRRGQPKDELSALGVSVGAQDRFR